MEDNSPLAEISKEVDALFLPEDPVKLSDASLTPQMVLFCHLVCSGFAPRVAAKKAGYRTEQAGTYLIKNPRVQEEINQRRSMMVLSMGIQKETLVAELLRILHELPKDIQGTNLKLKCLDMLSKVSGFYSPDTLVQVAEQIQNISVEIIPPPNQKEENGN